MANSKSHFFIERPIFAAVLSIIMTLVGAIAFTQLPVTQYPAVVPPTIVVSAAYPGANAQTVADTVANPLEAAINGVENMLYMSSYSSSDGTMGLTITFRIGTDIDLAQVQVQNRVNTAEPRLPEEVRRLGVNTAKSSPDFMMVVHLLSPDKSLDQLYVSNYTILRIRDQIARIDGVGDAQVFGAREYAIRIWLDPDKLANLNLTAGDVVNALRSQNVQVSGGGLGLPPVDGKNAFQYTVTTQGRFSTPEQFAAVIVKTGEEGQITRLSDVARVELGAKDYVMNSYLNGQEAVAIAVMQRPGSNALDTAQRVIDRLDELKKQFPKGLDYQIVYNPTNYISASIEAVYHTLGEAILLVVLVVIIFLQSWRASIIPIIAIPVSLIGTFAVMQMFGFSLNLLTLFGMVLAIGIVVDDAIVVVENMERHIADGKTPKDAAKATMNEVGGAVIAIALVLCAVFIPTAFIPGMSGQFYKQFAMTIAVATVISAINSLTLSPALGAWLLRKHEHHGDRRGLARLTGGFSDRFNRGFDKMGHGYAKLVKGVVRISFLMLIAYGGLVFATVFMANKVPTGFIPAQDQGYAIVVIQLPDGASLARTDRVTRRAMDIMMKTPGVEGAVAFAGLSGETFSSASNSAAIFATFKDFDERLEAGPEQNVFGIVGALQANLSSIEDAFVIAIPPPPVQGIGNAGGFKMMLKDEAGLGLQALMGATYGMMGAANQTEGLTAVYSTYSANSPQVYLDIDRTKAQMLGIPLPNVFETLQIYLGSAYVNDFNAYGRIYQVTAQADLPFRLTPQDIAKLKTRNDKGEFVPLGTIVTVKETVGPGTIQRYNQAVAIALSGNTAPGFSSGEALAKMQEVADNTLPRGITYEWTELALQQLEAGDAALYIFALSVIFVFLVLSAMYESWTLPIAIILIVPMSVLAALIGVDLRGMDNNILTQIGLVVLIGLAAKNAILIVEFARHRQEHGETMMEAIVEACRLRLRPILMTSFAFILGVLPLVFATGPGAEMRQSMGTAVFSGMIGVTIFGLMLTPVFYALIQKLTGRTGPLKPLHEVEDDPWVEECAKAKAHREASEGQEKPKGRIDRKDFGDDAFE